MFKQLFLTVLVSMTLCVGAAAAQSLQVGYMNPQQVLNQLPESTNIEQQLNTLIQQRSQEFNRQATAFQEAVTEYQQNASSMTDQQRSQREQELSSMDAELAELQQSIQQQIEQRNTELMTPIYQRMDSALRVVAERMNLDLVLNEATSTGETIIYYSSDQNLNITQQVLDQMTGASN